MRRRPTGPETRLFALPVLATLTLVAGSAFGAAPPDAGPPPFVSPIFGDHMVLQRGKPNAVWGWSQPGDTVRVEIGMGSATAAAGVDGRWETRVQTPPPGGPYTVRIIGRQTVELHDVMVGDVWICAGQSNMQVGLAQARNGAEEIKNADHPGIRYFVVGQRVSYGHVDVPLGAWKVVSPDALAGSRFGGISAVAYFFARKVHQSTRVPIGLVQVAAGGVPAETLASPESLRPLEDFDAGLAEVEQRAQKGDPEYGNYIMHWYDEYDVGSRNGSWADPELDDSSWKGVQIPGRFEELGLADTPGLVWLRKMITLPGTLPPGPARLLLGSIDKMDTTYVNGKQVGASSWVENPRAYSAGSALTPGRNVIAVRLFKAKPGGGFLNPAGDLRLTLGDGTSIPLGGEWKGRVAVDGRPPQPLPIGFENLPSMPGVLYRGMLEPITPLALTGAVWYQGESNTVRAHQYRRLLPALISGWRRAFGQGDFPFYIVGLPRYQHHRDVPGTDDWAEMREAQALTAKAVPHSCLAVTIDTGDADNIHPPDKEEPGDRLADCALAEHYGLTVPHSGPTLASVRRLPGAALELRFADAEGGLVVKGDKPAEFSVAGDDRQFHWADARVEGDAVIVSSPAVPDPKAVRYAWQANPVATLFNAAGLPAAPFRTDDWPGVTEIQPSHPVASRASAGVVAGYEKTADGLNVELAEGRVQLSACSERAVRVLFTLKDSPPPAPSLAVVRPCQGFHAFSIRETKAAVSVVTARLEARLDRRTGAVSFHDPEGRTVLAETPGGRSLVAAEVLGEKTHHAEQRFDWATNEGLYGLGEQQSGLVNYRGHDVLLVQENTVDVVPMLVSSRGYGILWDNASETRLRDAPVSGAPAAAPSATRSGSLWSQMAEAIDYTFLYGPDIDDVIASYRDVTGEAPMFPRWAYGFWQSKERYKTQDEIVGVVREFRRRRIPIDAIVQDWFYWDPFAWGSHRFDRARYLDPSQMIRDLHAMDTRIMISVWAKFVPGSDNYAEMAARGFLYPPFDKAHGGPDGNTERYYDAFDPAARQLYWRQMDEALFSKGIDAWWLDATEPEIGDLKSDEARQVMAKTALGHGARQLNAYSLMTTEAVYRGQRQSDPAKRVFILTRSAFAGQQRNAAATWSGDIQATWDVFAKQVAAGINFGLSGIPYWTTDIGGFFVNGYPKGGLDPAYQELFTRWYQWGAFCPLFRVHGTTVPREMWRFGEPGSWAYDAQLRFDRLRYRLMPYIYSLAGHVTRGGGTILRGLPFDFRADPRVRDVADEHMFGSAFLVSPVLQPLRYAATHPDRAIPASAFVAPDGTAGALQGDYFADKTLTRRVATRKDAAVDFDWGLAAPLPEVGADQFSVRWTGRLRAPETGEYDLATIADDGVRLWLDGKLLIDDWNQHAPEYHSGRVTLEAGRQYEIKLEYYDEILGASVKLSWTRPSDTHAAEAAPSKPMLRRVYLPAGADWYDFWTGERLTGGRAIESPAPLDIMPLHVRAGSIVPMGPDLQYADEKPANPLELRVYRGADARFELYEDEGDGYAYEKGVFATIPIEWSEARHTLTIGARTGSFPGMLEKRTVHVVFVGKGHGTGLEAQQQPDATIEYAGQPVTLAAR